MSMFSEYLNQLIQGRGITISKLSRESGVERTTIHKALTGGRILSYRAMEALAYYLKLSPQESQQLKQYHDMLFEGEAAYRSREAVTEMLKDVSDLWLSRPRDDQERGLPELDDVREKEAAIFKGYTKIDRLVQLVLAEEMDCPEPGVRMAVPASVKVLENGVTWLYRHYSKVKITHIIALDASTEKYNLHNLECVRNSLPGCVLSGQQYHVYYYYSDLVNVQYTDPLPYFLLTHNGVVCFSQDCQTAIYLKEKEQIEYFRICFANLAASCRKLVEYVEDAGQAWKAFWDASLEDGLCCLMSQPGFSLSHEKLNMAFTREGVRTFLETGRQFDVPGKPLEVADAAKREELVLKLSASIQNGAKARILNDFTVEFPHDLAMLSSAKQGILLYEVNGKWAIRIKEPSIGQALHDWMVHLMDGKGVQGQEETLETLWDVLKVWQKSLAE